jgi:hypothetical protein
MMHQIELAIKHHQADLVCYFLLLVPPGFARTISSLSGHTSDSRILMQSATHCVARSYDSFTHFHRDLPRSLC